MKNNYFLILFAEKNIVSATSDIRKYIFPKNARSMSFLCFSCFFSRYPFLCHVVLFPLFRPSLTRVYEKQLFLDTFCWKKHCIGNVRHAKVHFPKKCSFCVFLVFIVFFFFSVPILVSWCTSRIDSILCLVLLGFSCLMLFPFFCSRSISFCVFLVFLVFFSRYPFSCHVVPFPLFRPSLTCVYEKKSMFWYFLLKKTLYRQRQTCESTFFPKNGLNTSKMYRYIFDVLEKNVPVHFWRTKTGENVQYIFGGPPPLRGGDCIDTSAIGAPTALMKNYWKSNTSSCPSPRRMSGVQGGLGEHKRDILKLREALGGSTASCCVDLGMTGLKVSKLQTDQTMIRRKWMAWQWRALLMKLTFKSPLAFLHWESSQRCAFVYAILRHRLCLAFYKSRIWQSSCLHVVVLDNHMLHNYTPCACAHILSTAPTRKHPTQR